MGIDSSAHFGYGFKITNKSLCDKINRGEEIEDGVITDFDCGKDFEIVYGGDSYSDHYGEFDTIYLFIKKSHISVYTWNMRKTPISSDKLKVPSEWDEKLKAWCQEHGQKKPKIGWWLTASLS